MLRMAKSRGSSGRDWWKLGGIAALVAVVVLVGVGAGVYAARPAPQEPAAAYVPVAPERLPRLAVIGDSYSAGANNKVKWPTLLAKSRGWYVNNVASGGTGYVADPETSFPTKGGQATEKDPDIVIVAGSRNDQYAPRAAVYAAATGLYAELKEKAPQAQIVVIGPMWDSSAPTPGVIEANIATRDAAAAAGLPFLDALAGNWLADRSLVQADNTHPTDDGQRVIFERIDEFVPDVQITASS